MISEGIANYLTQVINAAKGTDISEAELSEKLLDATRFSLKQSDPMMEQYVSIDISPERVASIVARKIYQDRALQSALPSDTSRSIEKLIINWGLQSSILWGVSSAEEINEWYVDEIVLNMNNNIPKKIFTYVMYLKLGSKL